MLTHPQIWRAIDALASRHDMSPSGLAKLAGLDPTTFNKSKRGAANGKLRWPSTESLAKVLSATGVSLDDFVTLVNEGGHAAIRVRMVPLIGMAQGGSAGRNGQGVSARPPGRLALTRIDAGGDGRRPPTPARNNQATHP